MNQNEIKNLSKIIFYFDLHNNFLTKKNLSKIF